MLIRDGRANSIAFHQILWAKQAWERQACTEADAWVATGLTPAVQMSLIGLAGCLPL